MYVRIEKTDNTLQVYVTIDIDLSDEKTNLAARIELLGLNNWLKLLDTEIRETQSLVDTVLADS
jgi:vacuolar-type H+-ATPase subunit D/Vma8